MKLEGKVGLVTGAGSGIGRATAIELSKKGANIVVNYAHNEEGAKKTVKAIEEGGCQAILIKADVTKKSEVQNMVDSALKKFGHIDILVNNSGGIIERSYIAEITDELWNKMLALNLQSVFLCSRAVLPHMIKRQKGAIVNLSSIAARSGGGPGSVPYVTAKAAIDGFTRGLAKEVAAEGIRVIAVAPSIIDTPFHRDRELMAKFAASIPMDRMGTVHEVAKVIAFLATDNASFVTGTTVDVTGGPGTM